MSTPWNDVLAKSVIHDGNEAARKVLSLRKAHTVYPAQENLFRALQLTEPQDVRCVILGQDPYINPGQADGLAFSVPTGITPPPSLQNIFKEYSADLGLTAPASGDLTAWAQRGVLLLNSRLSVEAGQPLSHEGLGWQPFVEGVLDTVRKLPQPIVFLLWGGYARKMGERLMLGQGEKKAVLCSSHPSPLGATKGSAAAPAFLGSRPFSRANAELVRMGGEPIDWQLPDSEPA